MENLCMYRGEEEGERGLTLPPSLILPEAGQKMQMTQLQYSLSVHVPV